MRAEAPGAGGERGFTLMELLVSVIVLSVMMLLMTQFVVQANRSLSRGHRVTRATRHLRESLDTAAREIQSTDSDHIIIYDENPDADVVAFQLPFTGEDGAIKWGADGTENYWIRYEVAGGRLNRAVMNSEGYVVGSPREVAWDVDTAFGGAKGFRATKTDALVVMALRIVRLEGEQEVRQSTETSVVLRAG
jgi:prepilin-type N-terminal cleavage/methylation domain-containing protein